MFYVRYLKLLNADREPANRFFKLVVSTIIIRRKKTLDRKTRLDRKLAFGYRTKLDGERNNARYYFWSKKRRKTKNTLVG